MRYRRSTYRYAMVVRSGPPWPFGEIWQTDRLRLLAQGRWRPDADIYETGMTVEIVVDLAGVDEDQVELQLFEDALVVTGHRHLSSGDEGATYHAVAIRQGPFQLELPLPAVVDHDRVEARFERGLLRVTLPRRGTGT